MPDAGFFLKTGELRTHVSPEDLMKLLRAKQRSLSNRDPAFESRLLDTVRACDEHARDTNHTSIMEGMSYVLTYFDRFDSAATTINNLALMHRATLGEDSIRSLYGNLDIFEKVRPGLFKDLFFTDLYDNRYLTRYGRKKVEVLVPAGRGVMCRMAMAVPRVYLGLWPALRKAGLRAMAARRRSGGPADILTGADGR